MESAKFVTDASLSVKPHIFEFVLLLLTSLIFPGSLYMKRNVCFSTIPTTDGLKGLRSVNNKPALSLLLCDAGQIFMSHDDYYRVILINWYHKHMWTIPL